LIQFAEIDSAIAARTELDGQNIYSGCCTLRIQYSSLTNLNVQFNTEKSRDFTNPSLPTLPSNSMGVPYLGGGIFPPAWTQTPFYLPSLSGKSLPPSTPSASSVLIVSNLDSQRTSPDNLFTLFCVYGDVLRVKILHQKHDTALVQFVNPQQAETAMAHLNGCPLFGSIIRVNFSKHTTISLPRPGTEQEGSLLTKDYSGSPLHRFKVVGSRNYQHICPLSAVLHVSNLPDHVSEADLRDLFHKYGNVKRQKDVFNTTLISGRSRSFTCLN
jgi:polypyrimidine tract-binding protein 1